MKKVLYFALALLLFVLLAMPAAAQRGRGGDRSNKGGQVRGLERAEEVQQMNAKGAIAPGVEKAESKKKDKDNDADRDRGRHKGKHNRKHNGKHNEKDNDRDKDKDRH